MKKFFMCCALMAAVNGGAMAQYQLENPGFDGDWSSIQPYTGGDSKVVGKTPNGWCLANVAGYKVGIWFGSTEIGSKVDGHTDYACKLENKDIFNNIIPGYITLGTSWNTANTSGGNADGGSFGGVEFKGTPDAIEFWYKRTASDNSQPASVVAYMWKGKTSQASVPVSIGSSPTTATMENRDRNILGMSYSKGGAVTYSEDFSLIASLMSDVTYIENNQTVVKHEHIIKLTEEKTSWTKAVYEFEYHNTIDKPTMINVVFGAMDYFTDRSNHKKDNTLTVDDVKLLYYSELASGAFNGTPLTINANGTIEDVKDIYSEDKISLTSNGHGATIEKNYDEKTAILTVTVKGEDISENADNFHTYTIQFAKKGDVNGDGEVTIADVTALVNIILGKNDKKAIADVNGDGPVTIADVTALVNIILGK